MSIDFSTLQGLTIPEGNVTQITDASGRVIWAVPVASGPAVLEVEKITSNTYANSTSYSNEQFVLLHVSIKTGGTVSITYGGLTKTFTHADTSIGLATVHFGTYHGVSDEVETPTSGILTIEGDCEYFSSSSYSVAKSKTACCDCILSVNDFGTIAKIVSASFKNCTKLRSVNITSGVTSIVAQGFQNCTGLTNITVDSGNKYYSASDGVLFNKNKTELVCYPSVSGHYTIPNYVTSIGDGAFYACAGLTSITIPNNVTSIGKNAFYLASGNTRTVNVLSVTPATLISLAGIVTAFDDVGTNNIIVPVGSGDTYKNADGWSKYADYITEAS